MKKTSKSSAFANPRFLLAASLCVVALVLMASAFSGVARPLP